jgi:hypothetical protein
MLRVQEGRQDEDRARQPGAVNTENYRIARKVGNTLSSCATVSSTSMTALLS